MVYSMIASQRDKLQPRNDRVEEDRQLVQLGQQGARGQLPVPQMPDMPGTPGAQVPQSPTMMQAGKPPQSRAEEWYMILGDLNKGMYQLDAPAQAKLNDLNTKTEAILAQKGNLRPEEFELAMGSMHETAIDYPWDRHTKPPGSNPGDIVEEYGIMKLTEADGNRRPVAYTPEYMTKNAVPIGDTGKIAIPVAPDKPYEIVDAAPRDIASERGEIDKAQKGIEKIYTELAKQFGQDESKQIKDAEGNVIGQLPFTREERRRMSIMARDAYVKDQLQAKNAAKTIADAGAHELRQAVGGDVPDPYQTEQNIVDQSRDIITHRLARKDAAAELMAEMGVPNKEPQMPVPGAPIPTPSPAPPPGQQPPGESVPQGVEDVVAALQKAGIMSGEKTPEQRAEEAERYGAARDLSAAIASGKDFETKLVNAGANAKPLPVGSKQEMYEKYGDGPDGLTLTLPDGRRYVKDGTKFWQVPWNEKQLTSSTMINQQGEEVIDPNTGEAAPGIMQQLSAGKSREFSPSGMDAAARTGPPVRRGEPRPAPVPDEIAQQRMREMMQAADERQARLGQQMRKPGALTRPDAVDPERTAQAAAGVEASRLPVEDGTAPAMATQDAVQARTQQMADFEEMLSPQNMQARLRDLQRNNPSVKRQLYKPRKLSAGEGLGDVEAGEAFVSQSGYVWYKNEDGSLEGPFTEDQINYHHREQMQEVHSAADRMQRRHVGQRVF